MVMFIYIWMVLFANKNHPKGSFCLDVGVVGFLPLQWVADEIDLPPRRVYDSFQCWGGRIRTYAWGLQRPLPYRLATPQICFKFIALPQSSLQTFERRLEVGRRFHWALTPEMLPGDYFSWQSSLLPLLQWQYQSGNQPLGFYRKLA